MTPETSRYDLIVWDFDGTLADSLQASLRTYNALAPKHGCKPIGDADAIRGLGTRALMKTHGVTMVKLPRLIRDFLEAQKANMDGIRLVAGIDQVLAQLRQRGVRLGVLSSNSSENILTCLRANSAEQAFDFVIGYPKLFGKAAALKRVLKAEKIKPPRALYVGDEERDVLAARKAGVDVAAVTWGFHHAERLAATGPTHLVAQPAQLVSVVADA